MSELSVNINDTKIIGYSTHTEYSQIEYQSRQWEIKHWDEEILDT
jgi:hypothetical protein